MTASARPWTGFRGQEMGAFVPGIRDRLRADIGPLIGAAIACARVEPNRVDPPTDQSQPRERDPADDDASPRIPGHRGALPRAGMIDRWITDAMIVERRRATPRRLPPRPLGARLAVPLQDPSDGQSEPPSA